MGAQLRVKQSGGRMKTPTPDQIRGARVFAGLTQVASAALIHSRPRTWQDWEMGVATMHAGLWELFLLKAGLRKLTKGRKTKNEGI